MNLKANIEAIVNAMTGPTTFRYGTKHDENINGDSGDYPAIVLLEPESGGFDVQPMNGSARDVENTFIQFIDQIVMGEQADNREQVIEAQKSTAVAFIQALNNSNLFQDIAQNGYRWVVIRDYYDANVAGIELNIPNLITKEIRPCY